MSDILVNVTVTSYNRLECTKKCLEALRMTSGVPYCLTVVDNNSTDGSREYLEALHEAGQIRHLLLCRRNVGVAPAANLGWAAVDAPWYVKLDNDVEVLREDWLGRLLQLAERYPDSGTLGYYIEKHRAESDAGEPCFVEERSVGSCVLISREVHERLGFWNEDYGLYGMEDSDFSTRINVAGLKNRYVSHSERYIRHSHNLYRNNQLLDDEIRKTHGVSDAYTAVFYFNNGLFMGGVRPLRVERKYRPRLCSDGRYEFLPDPDYLAAEHFYAKEREDFVQHYCSLVENEG